MNQFVIILLGIWICATITAAITKDSDSINAAVVVSIVFGVGYLFVKMLINKSPK
jgi:uncharacterized membrane protein YcaP (DUF421 family)